MKPHKNWSYAPYKPMLFETGNPYICRVAPTPDTITFDWLPLEDGSVYKVCFRERGETDFACLGETTACTWTIENLICGKEYEFCVTSGEQTSRIRLARCGESFGTIVNYVHPEDDCYSFSGHFPCSPSFVRHPDGHLLASMDLYSPDYPQNLTLIYRSDDDGKTWKYVCELFPCFWGKMFVYQGEVYMLANNTEYGDILIGKSSDGGCTWCEPTVLMRGSGGRNGEAGCHRSPMPLVEYEGRLWNTVEWGNWARGYHAVMVLSAPMGSDLLEADNWVFSEPVQYDSNWPGLPKGSSIGNMEGNLLVLDGKFCNVMRYDMTHLEPNNGLIMAYEIDTKNPEAPLKFYKTIEFPGNHSKFQIVYHPGTKKYYSIISRIWKPYATWMRNLLSLVESDDCEHWRVREDIMDMRDEDPNKVGFQYVDIMLEGDTLLYLCRTAMNNADSYHNSNYSIFGTIRL